MTPDPLETSQLKLRALLVADADALFALYGDPEAVRYMPDPAHEDASETRKTVETMMSPGGACYWAICERDSDQAIGFAGFLGAPVHGVAGAGYGLRRDRWRRGLGSEALTAITTAGFSDFGFDGIELWIDRRNDGSRAIAAHVGYDHRASFFQKYAHEETAHNTIVYGLYAHDWENGRAVEPAQRTPEPMNMLEPVLAVADVEAAIAYYRDVLGFRLDFLIGEPATHASVSLGDWSFQRTSIRFTREGAENGIGLSGTIYIHIGEDSDRLYARLQERGANLMNAPRQEPWGRKEFDLLDLNGYRLRFGSVQ